jgi:SAM-dependent methyltransferase
MPRSEYRFGEEARREADRLAAVERVFDEQTVAALREAGVGAGWRCWEVGAGRGSIAHWLGQAVGPKGTVLATDLHERWFQSTGAANVEFGRHDVTRDPLPDERFDLVHARFLLEHLADPRTVIDRLAAALRPRGVLMLEDSAGLEIGIAPPAEAFARLAPVWERAGKSVGWNAAYGRALIGDLRAAGLQAIHGVEYRQIAAGGAWKHVEHGLERLRPELREQGASDELLNAALRCLGDPANLITGPPVVIAWGRSES